MLFWTLMIALMFVMFAYPPAYYYSNKRRESSWNWYWFTGIGIAIMAIVLGVCTLIVLIAW